MPKKIRDEGMRKELFVFISFSSDLLWAITIIYNSNYVVRVTVPVTSRSLNFLLPALDSTFPFAQIQQQKKRWGVLKLPYPLRESSTRIAYFIFTLPQREKMGQAQRKNVSRVPVIWNYSYYYTLEQGCPSSEQLGAICCTSHRPQAAGSLGSVGLLPHGQHNSPHTSNISSMSCLTVAAMWAVSCPAPRDPGHYSSWRNGGKWQVGGSAQASCWPLMGNTSWTALH